MKKITKIDEEYVVLKLNQYNQIVDLFDDFYKYSKIDENEETFQLAKEIIVNKAESKISVLLSELFDYAFICLVKCMVAFIPLFAVFVEWVLKNKFDGKIFAGSLILVFIIYFAMSMAEKGCYNKPFNIRIIENISFVQYCELKKQKADQKPALQKSVDELKDDIELLKEQIELINTEK